MQITPMKATTIPRRPAYSRSTSYSHYSSGYSAGRRPAHAQKKSINRSKLMITLVLAVVIGLGVFIGFRSGSSSTAISQSSQNNVPVITPQKTPAVAPAPPVNPCAGNQLDKFIKISTEQRKLWACEGSKLVYDAPIISGKAKHAETITPAGTYKIYGKTTDTRLVGQDSTGSWDRPVSYWMPFLDNQHGTYGFHDATWRPDTEFGQIDPNSEDGSHGCIELTLAAQKWVYDWAPVGTTLTIES